MKYLWKMELLENWHSFKYTEYTEEKARKIRMNRYSFEKEQEYSNDADISKIVLSAFEMCRFLNLNLKYGVSIYREQDWVTVTGYYEIIRMRREKNGEIKVRTETGCAFTQKEYEAIFGFAEVLSQYPQFF